MNALVVGVPRETEPGERRVALVPAGVSELRAAGHTVLVETGAGAGAYLCDDAFAAVGAEVVARAEVLARADVLVGVGYDGSLLVRRSRRTER